MKIYNKKNFVSGMFITLLGIALIGMDLAKGWVWRDSIIHILCLALGLMLMVRSCSRTMARADRLAELDERNQLVLLKNRSRAFQIHRYSCLALAALFFFAGRCTGDPDISVCGHRVCPCLWHIPVGGHRYLRLL